MLAARLVLPGWNHIFSRAADILGTKRLHGTEAYESCLIKALLDRPAEDPQQNHIVTVAQEVWCEHYGNARDGCPQGTKRAAFCMKTSPQSNELCQRHWVKRRRSQAGQIAAAIARETGEGKIDKASRADLGHVWTPQHEKEASF